MGLLSQITIAVVYWERQCLKQLYLVSENGIKYEKSGKRVNHFEQ